MYLDGTEQKNSPIVFFYNCIRKLKCKSGKNDYSIVLVQIIYITIEEQWHSCKFNFIVNFCCINVYIHFTFFFLIFYFWTSFKKTVHVRWYVVTIIIANEQNKLHKTLYKTAIGFYTGGQKAFTLFIIQDALSPKYFHNNTFMVYIHKCHTFCAKDHLSQKSDEECILY